jgi:hypothetical protein
MGEDRKMIRGSRACFINLHFAQRKTLERSSRRSNFYGEGRSHLRLLNASRNGTPVDAI